jgi:prepilin-type N-terminal cleavage/methylation domain-containing protein
MRKAFTLIEMVVALGILAMVLSFAGVIFRVSTDSQRMAMANAEIMQKLRVITEQLDADFSGLCKDGEILVFWRAARKPNFTGANPNDPLAFERFDTIMFFATGDFSTYKTYAGNQPIRGNVARICYTLANVPSNDPANPFRPLAQKTSKRMLARTQHILVPPNPADPNLSQRLRGFTDNQWRDWNSKEETDAISMQGWLLIPEDVKADIISVAADVEVALKTVSSTKYKTAGGVLLNRADPASMYALLCDGVGQFEVQGWTWDDRMQPAQWRWAPDVNPDGDKDLTDDSDFVLEGPDLHPTVIPGLRYPGGPVTVRNHEIGMDELRDVPFNEVPGLGRALKFTFTLYDSRGLIPNGRTFTHIVYLDN